MRQLALLAGLALLAAGCSPGDEPSDGCDITVSPGDDDTTRIQTAFIEADAGSTVCLAQGTFSLRTELSIAKAGIVVRGAGRDKTILDFSKQDVGGNGLQLTGDDLTIEKLQVRDTPGDGIRASSVKGVTFRDVEVLWTDPASVDNGAYGLYPVGCDGVQILGCKVTGARDAGIYVGQSTHILVADSEAVGNVAGIELENSTDAEVRGCHAHDNTAGVLVFNLPDLPVFGGRLAKIRGNVIENNNLPSFAEAGTIVSKVPQGIGFILLAADDNEIHDNLISGNDSMALVMVSYLEILFGPNSDPAFEPFSNGNFIHGNTFEGNGGDPAPIVKGVVGVKPVPDMVWDGCQPTGGKPALNCVSENGGATYLNADLCGVLGHKDPDISKVTCTHDPVPPQTF